MVDGCPLIEWMVAFEDMQKTVDWVGLGRNEMTARTNIHHRRRIDGRNERIRMKRKCERRGEIDGQFFLLFLFHNQKEVENEKRARRTSERKAPE